VGAERMGRVCRAARARSLGRGSAPGSCPVLFLVLALAACGDDAPRVTISGQVNDIFSGQPVQGVRFCRLAAPNACAETDADGNIAVRLPAESDEWLKVDHPWFVPMLVGARTTTTDFEPPGVLGLVPLDILDTVVAQVGLRVEPGKGLLNLYAYAQAGQDGRAGVTLRLDPDPGGSQGYLNDQGDMTLDATATGSPGVSSWVNLEPGDYVATVSHPDYTCAPLLAIPGEAPDTFELKIQPDRLTYLIVVCE